MHRTHQKCLAPSSCCSYSWPSVPTEPNRMILRTTSTSTSRPVSSRRIWSLLSSWLKEELRQRKRPDRIMVLDVFEIVPECGRSRAVGRLISRHLSVSSKLVCIRRQPADGAQDKNSKSLRLEMSFIRHMDSTEATSRPSETDDQSTGGWLARFYRPTNDICEQPSTRACDRSMADK